ncbi:conserved hypothetical protein [Chlorobaculum parvum NCIB 8327]|uniref:Uncharacterized protein n=1 Tax=Chlorobaculum parvum (strain DSM 263 / NCIMB 8327) TaxID=517417 RepID=B3QNX9_CHLP8|nr:TorF family putative porin [Chlorobaculum parvum]ACF11632.1 conserved hypothetical protein [Chlorobaculum parvum NCIB 8327]
MKKTAKLIALAAVLFAGFGSSNAMAAEGFELGADIVSSYVWRGSDLGDSAAIQPSLSYTFENGLSVGLWGSYALSENSGTWPDPKDRYKEVDLTISMPVGPVTLAVTDYNGDPEEGNTFDFGENGNNTIEISASGTYANIDLMAAVFVAGNDYDNAWYCEAGYQFYDKDGYTAKAVAGLGNEGYYGDGEGKKLALVNTGIAVSKDRYTASAIYNPDTENSYLVFMASF